MAIAATFAVAFGIAGGIIYLKPRSLELRSGTLLETPRPVEDFTLANADGKPFTKADLIGHWTVIFPGFTYCPDVCPTTLATLKATQIKLGEDAAKVQIVMVSVDPQRDTPEKLGAYVHAFSPSFVGMTGSLAELENLSGSIGFVYSKVPGATPDTYSVDHSVSMSLISPDGRLAGYFTPPYKADDMASDLRELIALPAKAS